MARRSQYAAGNMRRITLLATLLGALAFGPGCLFDAHSDPITRCGDGELGGTEECDDGNRIDGDGCSFYCEDESNRPPPPRCGDGVVEGNEECDDGNFTANDGCDPGCTLTP